jgi:hypothetical protein
MQSKSISRILRAAAAIAIGCGALGSTASATAQSENKPCSNRTIFGDYGFALEGVILGPGLQLRGVVLQHYDGRGNLTQVDHIVTEGMPPLQEWTPGSGTYTVNPDCTGVAVKQGKEIHQVVDTNAVSTVGKRVK